MVRFPGFCRPTVARLPIPISISPSPVITTTGNVRLRQRDAEPDHDRAAHGAPQIEIAVVVAGGGDVVGRGAEAADHDGVLALRQQAADDAAAFEKICFAHLVKTFAPIRRCDNRTAVGVQAL